MRTVILTILDGWGIGEKNNSNPIFTVNPPNINYIKHNFLAGTLQASGIAVGLPWGEAGNSEIGHLTIGAGKVLYQHMPRISLAIRKGDFFKNSVLLKAIEHAKKNNSALHLVGLLTEGIVHAAFEHLEALIKLAEKNKIPKFNLHLFGDGRDSAPKSFLKLASKLKYPPATVSGRYYGMDRDKHWDRIEKAYKVLIGEGLIINDLKTYLQNHYDRDLSDEFIEPAIIGQEGLKAAIKDNDAIIFFNFREDRMRELPQCFFKPDFKEFPIKKINNLCIISMTPYEKDFNIPTAFPPDTIENPLGKVLADNNKSQLRIAETEKYAHVTYFFNGLKEPPMNGEFRILIHSRNVAHHNEYPEMRAREITERATQAIEERAYDFILMNYANSDIIAHTGDFNAGEIAVKTVDEEIGKLIKVVLENDDILIITADHGNIEKMMEINTWLPQTQHESNPVPIYLIAKEFQTPLKNETTVEYIEKNTVGIISDIAPTILKLMKLPQPQEMSSQNLIKFLQ